MRSSLRCGRASRRRLSWSRRLGGCGGRGGLEARAFGENAGGGGGGEKKYYPPRKPVRFRVIQENEMDEEELRKWVARGIWTACKIRNPPHDADLLEAADAIIAQVRRSDARAQFVVDVARAVQAEVRRLDEAGELINPFG
jgi:hypothetical protein